MLIRRLLAGGRKVDQVEIETAEHAPGFLQAGARLKSLMTAPLVNYGYNEGYRDLIQLIV